MRPSSVSLVFLCKSDTFSDTLYVSCHHDLLAIYDILNNWITPKVPIIRWIPGHSNFPGNNAADDFANHAVDSAEIPSLGFSTFNL